MLNPINLGSLKVLNTWMTPRSTITIIRKKTIPMAKDLAVHSQEPHTTLIVVMGTATREIRTTDGKATIITNTATKMITIMMTMMKCGDHFPVHNFL